MKIHIANNIVFHYYCENGNKDIMIWLYELSKVNSNTKMLWNGYVHYVQTIKL